MLQNLSFRKETLALLAATVGGLAVLAIVVSCDTGNPSPVAVAPPAVVGNVPPTLTVTSPSADFSLEQGASFTIRWTDTDRDSSAQIAFDLVSAANESVVIPLVTGLDENDVDADGRSTSEEFVASTAVVAPGDYYIRGTIWDNLNAPVEAFASADDSGTVRVVLSVTQAGFAPPSSPPIVVVTEPVFNLSVAQDDQLTITVSPTETIITADDTPPENPIPYDSDSNATLYILLDVDSDPTNDDPANPDPDEVIVLDQRTIESGAYEAVTVTESVDLGSIPVRNDGKPYYVRATVDDESNDPVHAYAKGTVHVGSSASGSVDLGQVGKMFLGATFRGFNPGSELGWRMVSARDFDVDGVDDFVLVARKGNPRNFGNIGEAYLIYGLDQLRFGGVINVNAVSTDIAGVIFEAPPVRLEESAAVDSPRTEGITDVATIGDINGDGRPDLLFGLPHVDGVFQGRDDDPGDDPPEPDATLQVELMVRQGTIEMTEGDDDPATVGSYSGFEDTVIKSAAPNSNFGSETELEWDDDGVGERVWTLIRIKDLLDAIPDAPGDIDIDGLTANLTFQVIGSGGQGQVHECFTSFSESSVTFNNFAVDGDEPQGGDPDVPDAEDFDYDEEALGSLNGEVGAVDVDISPLVRDLLNGQLEDNEIRLIIVPGEGESDGTQLLSSESNDPEQIPAIEITYQRGNLGGARGCYPDSYANNLATEEEEDDVVEEALGFVSVVYSDNRDNNPLRGDATRLETTVVALELAGQEAGLRLSDGLITQRAEGAEDGRIAGFRVQAGWYDRVDHLRLNQPPLEGLFGWNVSSMPDLDGDDLDEIIISAPTNELDIQSLEEGGYFPYSTHLQSRFYFGSIMVIPGGDYGVDGFRDKGGEDGCASLPANDHQLRVLAEAPTCNVQNPRRRGGLVPTGDFEISAEDPTDFLCGGQYAGDFNLDGVPDILAGAPLNDSSSGEDAGAAYVLYQRVPVGNIDLALADNPATRSPMLRIRGDSPGDQIGLRQERLGDVNGDRIADIVIASEKADFGGVARATCAADFDGDGDVDDDDLSTTEFNACSGDEVFLGDACKAFDYDNDRVITDADREVFECLQGDEGGCCPVDNGFVGVVFGGVTIDGDRDISQIATGDLPGVQFYGASAGERAGADISSAGDFNQDGFEDLLIAAPGRQWEDSAGEVRLGVVYLIFGGPHLTNERFSLSLVGSDELPGIVFYSPYFAGRPNEAPPDRVGYLGDINNDGFTDIAIGCTRADFIDETLPQDPDDPGTDPSSGRRPDAGDVYIIYGNNFGGNR